MRAAVQQSAGCRDHGACPPLSPFPLPSAGGPQPALPPPRLEWGSAVPGPHRRTQEGSAHEGSGAAVGCVSGPRGMRPMVDEKLTELRPIENTTLHTAGEGSFMTFAR